MDSDRIEKAFEEFKENFLAGCYDCFNEGIEQLSKDLGEIEPLEPIESPQERKPAPEVWGYSIFRLRGAWVRHKNSGIHWPIESVDPNSEAELYICINQSWHDAPGVKKDFDIDHNTVQPLESGQAYADYMSEPENGEGF